MKRHFESVDYFMRGTYNPLKIVLVLQNIPFPHAALNLRNNQQPQLTAYFHHWPGISGWLNYEYHISVFRSL
jgi:hypothetical protein